MATLKENSNVANVQTDRRSQQKSKAPANQNRVLQVHPLELEEQVKRISAQVEEQRPKAKSRSHRKREASRLLKKQVIGSSKSTSTDVIAKLLHCRDEADLLLTEKCALTDSVQALAHHARAHHKRREAGKCTPKAVSQLEPQVRSAESIQAILDLLRDFFAVYRVGQQVCARPVSASDSAEVFRKAWAFEAAADRPPGSLTTTLLVNGVRAKPGSPGGPVALLARSFLQHDRALGAGKAVSIAESYMHNLHRYLAAPVRSGAAFAPFLHNDVLAAHHVGSQGPFEPSAAVVLHVAHGPFCAGWGLGVALTLTAVVHLVAQKGTEAVPPKRRLARLRLQLSNECLFRALLLQDQERELQALGAGDANHEARHQAWLLRNTAVRYDLVCLRESHAAEEMVYTSAAGTCGTQEEPARTRRAVHRDIPRLERQADQAASDSAYNYLLGWGQNAYGVLGPDTLSSPLAALEVPGLLDLTRVARIDCSWYHVIALTDVGLVFTWGSGSEGALGHGDLEACTRPRCVEALLQSDPPQLCVDVACASDLVGAHSAAITTRGECFTWGFGVALGHAGDTRDKHVPTLIESSAFGPVDTSDTSSSATRPVDTPDTAPSANLALVRCGGGFCVAATATGETFSWGLWANGRLGLGPPPAQTARPTRRGARLASALLSGGEGNSRPKVQRYQLSPRTLHSLATRQVRHLACGQAHALAVDAEGLLLSWGKNGFGQLGNGTLADQLLPAPLSAFIAPGSYQGRLCFAAAAPPIAQVRCGAFHSLAIDQAGALYSWGAKGGAVLGHGAAGGGPVSCAEADQGAYLLQTEPWRWPRAVRFFAGDRVQQVAAGVQHTVARTGTGRLYSWGSLADDLVPLQEEAALVQRVGPGESSAPEGATRPGLVDTPRLVGERVEDVACGAWHTLAVVSGTNSLAGDLGRCFKGLKHRHDDGSFSNALETDPDACDLVLVVGQRALRCHKAVVASRSPVLAEEIEREELPGIPTEILIPDIKFETALAMVHYLYADSVFTRLDPTNPRAAALAMAAKEYKLDRLLALCRKAVVEDAELENQHSVSLGTEEEEGQEAANWLRQQRDGTPVWQIPRSTLAADLEYLVNNPRWSDMRFVIETSGELVPAHQVILRARSKYFSNLLQDRVQSSASQNAHTTVQVPETIDCLLRTLHYLYTGQVAQAPSVADLLQDWAAAIRYELDDLRAICESRIPLNSETCCMVLQVAYSVGNETLSLKERALETLVDSLGQVHGEPCLRALEHAHPRVIEDIYVATLAREYVEQRGSREVEAAVEIEMKRRQESASSEKEDEVKQTWKNWLPTQDRVALLVCLGMIMFGALIASSSSFIQDKELLQYIPWANGIVLVAAAIGATSYISA